MESELEAFEMWAYRRTLRVSGMDGTLNGKYSKFIIANNKEKKMPIFWTHNKREVDPKILTGRQNWREERTGETKNYLDEKRQRTPIMDM